jgi:V-type H+-transporting ATPase subunit E
MNDEMQRAQITQMESFIIKEAEDKANEIRSKGEEEFGIEKFKIVTGQKEKIRQEYTRKAKQVETQCAISRSLAINKSRLEKIKARQNVLSKISVDSKEVLAAAMLKESESKPFLTKLILQGALMLLEESITVQCRQCDVALVESCLAAAAKEYSEVIAKETGAKRSTKFTIDKASYLPPAPKPGSEEKSCLGGVVLFCQNGTIKIDNTIDLRLQLVLEQDKPAIRNLLFPVH